MLEQVSIDEWKSKILGKNHVLKIVKGFHVVFVTVSMHNDRKFYNNTAPEKYFGSHSKNF